MKFYFYTFIPDGVKKEIERYMESYYFENEKDDSEVTRLYCYYNSEFDKYTDFTINPEKLIDNIDSLFEDTEIIEIDLYNYYMNKLKKIVKIDAHCNYNQMRRFNLIARELMNYGNEQVLNSNYSISRYNDIFKTIIKLKEVI